MEENELFNKASITKNGAVLLGDTIVCDGYDDSRRTAVFTHIHTDHTKFFETALGKCSENYVTRPTFELLVALKGDYLKLRNNLHALNFGVSIMPSNEKITLLESQHILGSCQVLVETSDGVKINYTSDFTYPNTKPVKCDVLVLDSTHGDPRFGTIVDRESTERRFIDIVKEEIRRGQPVCVRAHRGRLQYVMHLVSATIHDDIPFLTSKDDAKIIPVYRKYGMPIRNTLTLDSWEGKKITKGTYPYVEFRTFGSSMTLKEESGMRRVLLAGLSSSGGTTIRDNGNNVFQLEFADHANYQTIMDYVQKATPKVVITDNYRGTMGKTLAERINTELGIPTKSMPEILTKH